MSEQKEVIFKEGERVVSPERPDWGTGRILAIETYPGQTALRIRVSFSGVGVKTMVVPPGRLVRPGEQITEDQRLKEQLAGGKSITDRLLLLPGVVTDRLAGLDARLEALAKLYRFDETPRSIFDWAVMQTGEADPLTTFTADELARSFRQFVRRRDQALGDLLKQAKAEGIEQKSYETLQRWAPEQFRRRIRAALSDK